MLLNMGTELVGAFIGFLLLQVVLKRVADTDGYQTQGFAYDHFVREVRNAKKVVRIFSTFVWLLSDNDTYKEVKEEFFANLQTALHASSELEVEILLLDPYSDAAKQRREDLKHSEDDFIDAVSIGKHNLSELFYFLNNYPALRKRVHVRIYDTLPRFQMFQVDNEASISFFPLEKTVTHSRTSRYNLTMNSPLGSYLTHSFQELWDAKRRTLTLDDYMQVSVTYLENTHRTKFVKDDLSKAFYLLYSLPRDRKRVDQLEGLENIKIIWHHEEIYCKLRKLSQEKDRDTYTKVCELAEQKYAASSAQFQFIFEAEKIERNPPTFIDRVQPYTDPD